jgi:anthranilate phosphoribosyltransferase
MANPARVRRQVIGVANPAVAAKMLASLRVHGSVSAWVVHGNGLDELATTGPSSVLALEDGHVREFRVDPVQLGLAPAIAEELRGGDPTTNAAFARRVLAGERGPHRDIVVLNAAAAFVVAGVDPDLAAGLARAEGSIDSGAAARALEDLVNVSGQGADRGA